MNRNIAIAFALLTFLIVVCGCKKEEKKHQRRVQVEWTEIGTWKGSGNANTELLDIPDGAQLRLRWRLSPGPYGMQALNVRVFDEKNNLLDNPILATQSGEGESVLHRDGFIYLQILAMSEWEIKAELDRKPKK
jgi:hypothetical protein